VDRTVLKDQTILVVEGEPLIALDLRTSLEAAGAKVLTAHDAAEALAGIDRFEFTAGVIDWRPQSDEHRRIARALKQRGVRFLFYATHPPEDVTTVRGAPVFLKPAHPEVIVKALTLLVAG
jgi:DNA-binding response OmpR family regulator